MAANRRVGLAFVAAGAEPRGRVDRGAAASGIETAWMAMPAAGLDSSAVFAAAAMRAARIALGTAVVPALVQQPLELAGQALALEGLAPGRLRRGHGWRGSGPRTSCWPATRLTGLRSGR